MKPSMNFSHSSLGTAWRALCSFRGPPDQEPENTRLTACCIGPSTILSPSSHRNRTSQWTTCSSVSSTPRHKMRVLYRLRKCVSDYRRRIVPSHKAIVIKSPEEAELELQVVEDCDCAVHIYFTLKHKLSASSRIPQPSNRITHMTMIPMIEVTPLRKRPREVLYDSGREFRSRDK